MLQFNTVLIFQELQLRMLKKEIIKTVESQIEIYRCKKFMEGLPDFIKRLQK
jgi:hypothetical protein